MDIEGVCGRIKSVRAKPGLSIIDDLIDWLRTQPDVVRELKKRAAGDNPQLMINHKFGD